MAKTCIVNRDENNKITSVLVRNPHLQNNSDPIQIATERNNGHDLSLTPNGKPSLLYQTYINEMGMTEDEAKQEVSKVYSDEFFSLFGDWIKNPNNSSKVVDENGQPKLVWSGHPEKVENYKAYTNREEEDRIDNDAFFPEDKAVADSYANAGFQMTREQAAKYKLPYRDAQPVFLNIRNPQNVEENSGLLITPLIEEAISNGNDGFYGNTIHRTDSKTWSILDGKQVIPIDTLSYPTLNINSTKDYLVENDSVLNYLKNDLNLPENLLKALPKDLTITYKLLMGDNTMTLGERLSQTKSAAAATQMSNIEINKNGKITADRLGDIQVNTLSNLIYRLKGSSRQKSDIFHETVHAGTLLTMKDLEIYYKSNLYKKTNKYTEEQVEAYENIKFNADYYKGLYAQGRKRKPFGTSVYGLENEYEFVAEFMSNPKFKKWLLDNSNNTSERDKIQKKKGILARIWDDIKVLLGFRKSSIDKELEDEITKDINTVLELQRNNFNNYVEYNNDVKEEFIPSKLYNQIREIPFINEEQSLDFYKNIYRPEMSFWQEVDSENLDEETKEPKLYFKGDNDNVYTNLSETLKNSSNSFSVGFLNAEGEFTSYLESPIYSEADIKGKTQSLVKNDYLKPTEKEENTFEAQDSLSAEMIEEDLAITNPFSYERNGNNFTVEEVASSKTYNQLIKEIGVIGATRLSLVNKFFDLKNKTIKPKEVLYNENQLYNAIQSFMKRLGISETTIDNYKERYEAKFGIEPDANAFIDINNKIIATVNGKATLDELSEEVSHFIIEAWNQDEIARLLPYVKNASYYAQFAENYREIYSKQISDANEVENYVNKEILGKMLAESMKNNFSLDNKTEVERNLFERLGDILRNFINYIQNKITPKEVNDIDFFTKQVSNLLYNQELEANLERLNPQSTTQIMYSISPRMDSILKRFGKQISRTINSGDLTEEALAIRGATTIFNDNLIKADSLLDEVRKYVDSDTVIPSTIDILVSDLLGKREDLELLRTEAIREINRKPELKDLLSSTRQLADMTLQKIAELSGEVQLISSREPEIVAEELLKEIGENRRVVVDSVIDSVRGAQRDTNWLGMNFAHVGKMSNAFISLMNQIVKRMLNKSEIDTNADFDTYAQKLLPYQQKLKNFFKGGSFISNVDNDKITEDKIKFEYSLRKEAGDETLDETTEEDFIKDYSNVDKLDKNSKAYYIYDALYKERYSSQDWADTTLIPYYDNFIKNMKQIIGEEGLREGNSALYVTLKNYSDRRSQYKEGDPLRKSENEQIAIDRKSASNIFNKDGSIKEGLSYIRYSEAKAQGISDSDIVSTNPRLESTDNDFVVVIDRDIATPTVGKLAFDMLKWNSLNLSEKGDKNLLKENFKNEYNKKLRSLQNLNYHDRNTQLREWVKENIQFDMSDEYWNNLDFEGINFEGLRNVVSSVVGDDINRKEAELNTLKLQRANILKLYKVAGDYKEIAADKIPSDDKLAIEKLEIGILNLKNDLSKVFDEYGIKMYSQESSPIVELNQSFYEIFEKEIGIRYEDSTFNQKRTFFSGQYGMSSERYAMFLNFQRLLNQDNTLSSRAERQINKYRNLAKDPSSNESISEAYLRANAPSWYKRYDANTEYGNFVRDFNIGAISVEDLVKNYLETDSFNYNGVPLDMMQINPAFKFTLAKNATTSELYEEYKNMPDNTLTDLRDKFNQLMVMGGNMNLKNITKQDLSFITDNEENLRAYVYMMDYHLRSLDVSNSLTQNNVFTRPQKRKGGLERYQTIVTKGDKVNQLKDALKEKFQYREDDFEDAYKSQQLPKYGLYRVDPSELTDDILGSLIWFNAQSNNYNSRMKSYGLALKAMSALSNQSFDKGKQGVETNYYKVAKGMLDYNFYGKTTTMKIETNILGQKIDLAKVLMGFKGFAITQALAFSPIVALTNVISGVTQNQFLKWTGKNIYSPADDRAQLILAPLTANSTSDIGKLAPTSKLNKLMYQFGVYNIEERFKNADFNRTARLIPEAGFGMMAVGNYLLQSRVVLSKLMEVRLIDGKFQSWRDYTLEQKRLNPNITNSELKSKFNESKEKSMYDYLDDNGKFQTDKLEADGYDGNIENDKLRVVSRIQDIGEQVTMEIRKHNEGEAARSPFWSFALSLKKWLILANTQMFSRRRLDLESGGEEEGLIFSYKNMFDLVNRARKENISMAQAYRELDEVQQKNIRTTGIITASMTVLLALAFMLKKLADDDDEKDNYALQLGNYMLLRNLNEVSSSNLGIANSLYESVQTPVSTISVFKNLGKILDVRDIGQETTRGKYKGMDKYLTSWVKLTAAKNVFTLKDAETIKTTRTGYEFFNTNQSLYSIFSLLPAKEE